MEKDFDADEKRDEELIKEALEKHPDYAGACKWLTAHWTTKYGPEFGGIIRLEYEIVGDKFILTCGEQKRDFPEDELSIVPSQIKFFRKSRQ